MIHFSNAKINIGLQVLAKRSDGFHDIHSVFVPIPFYDIIEIIPHQQTEKYLNTGIVIDCELEKNTCYKAYKILQSYFPKIDNCYIHHNKIIPTGTGLGAGSANAVVVLKLLAKIFELQISDALYLNIAEQIGSDCAFFINNKTAFVSGKGESVEPLNINLSGFQLGLLLPKNIAINTQWAYSKIIIQKNKTPLKELILSPIQEWENTIHNDFEIPVFEAFPILKNAKEKMYHQGAIYAAMSGSGGSIYGIFKNNVEINTTAFEENFIVKKLRF